MDKDKYRIFYLFTIIILGFIVFPPLGGMAAENPVTSIDTAKAAIEQAQRAGAEQRALDELSAARSWLVLAEKAFASSNSLMAMISTSKMKKDHADEVIYLATMAKIKGMTAEAIAKKFVTAAKLKDMKKDLSDYQSAILVMNEKQQQAEMAKAIQAKAEAERKQLEESKLAAEEMEAQKRKELLEAQRKTAELEVLKQKEIQATRLKQAEREKETAQRAKEAMEIKAGAEKLSEEKMKLAAMQAKLQALEQEKAMLIAAGQIPKVTAKAGDKKIIMTILAIHLFTSTNDLSSAGKDIMDSVAGFLKNYPNNKIVARGHTDSKGKLAANQELSEKRAQKVREYLVAYKNIAPGRITAEGIGSAQPVATNASEAGRALNRRVELTILTGEH